jgi:hypothetical protein
MTYIPVALRTAVTERARGCCEYCRIHQDDCLYSHEVDHIVALKHGGYSDKDNMGLACSVCNRNKGSDLSSLDPQTRAKVFLFDPRTDDWDDHSRLNDDGTIEGITPVGRATVAILGFNEDERVIARRELMATNRYPCPDEPPGNT